MLDVWFAVPSSQKEGCKADHSVAKGPFKSTQYSGDNWLFSAESTIQQDEP